MEFSIMKLFEDKDYVSPGSIGGKIKRIRELRGYTQKQLGIACGFSQTSADVRIAQYEKNKKIPREKVLINIASALGIDDCALYDADMLSYNRMYHALFDLEDFHSLHPVKKNDGYYLEFGGHTILGKTSIDMISTNFSNNGIICIKNLYLLLPIHTRNKKKKLLNMHSGVMSIRIIPQKKRQKKYITV